MPYSILDGIFPAEPSTSFVPRPTSEPCITALKSLASPSSKTQTSPTYHTQQPTPKDPRHPTLSSLPPQLNTLLPTRKDRRRPITPPPSLQHTIDLNIKHHIPNSSQHQLFPTHTTSALQQTHHYLRRKPKEKKKANREPTKIITTKKITNPTLWLVVEDPRAAIKVLLTSLPMSHGFSHGLVHCLDKAQAMRAPVQSQ